MSGLKSTPVISPSSSAIPDRIKIPFAAATLIAALLVSGCSLVSGAFDKQPEDTDQLSKEAQTLIKAAYADVDPSLLTDYHNHIFGLGPDSSGTFVNKNWQSLWHPISYFLKFRMYMSAAGITDIEKSDEQMFDRLSRLVNNLPGQGKFGLMAFDYFHHADGRRDKSLSTFHVPNDYVFNLAAKNPTRFFPIVSIHPYRKDAVERLRHYADRGAGFVKWLPNAMGIHPSPDDPKLRKQLLDYYAVMKEYNMVLISHTGDEKATEAEEFQHLGNPLYLKLPLEAGVKVVIAHMASLGECKAEDAAVCTPGRSYTDIAIEMMRDKNYQNTLFGEISALTQFNRRSNIDAIVQAGDIHDRLINGSDYPLPAVNFVIQTRALVRSGHITSDERTALNEIYDVNALLFDYVLKRTIKHSKTGEKFPASVFMKNGLLENSPNIRL